MQVSFNYCPTAFNLDLLVYTEMLCKDAVDLNALKEDVFHLAQSKICTTRNLGLSNLVNADYKIKYDNEIQLAEDEEMVDFGSEPYVEDYKIQTSEERCAIPDIDILQRELEKMQAELGLQDIVSEEVDLDNLENSRDNSQQIKFYSNVESDSNLAEDKVEEVEEKEEDENSSASEADLTTEDDESKSDNNQVISATKTTDEVDEKTQDELLEEVGMSHDTQDEPEQELEPNVQEHGTDDFEDEYLNSDILKSIEVIEENLADEEDEEHGIQSEDYEEDISSDDEEDEDISSNYDDDEEDDYDLSSDEEDDSEDISSCYEDDGDDSEDISDSEEDEEDDEDEDSYDFNESDDEDEDVYDFSESDDDEDDDISSDESDDEDEDSYDFDESDDNEDDDISSDESDDQPVEEYVVYEDEYLDSDIYSSIKILKKVKKKKQVVSEVSSSSSARQTTKSKKSSSTLGVETKKARDSRNVNDSSKSSGSLSKASKEVPKGAPSLESVVAQTEKSEFCGRDEEPKDLRSFLRKHPHCEMSVVYKYFTKKEVQNALLTGKVIKKGTQLHI